MIDGFHSSPLLLASGSSECSQKHEILKLLLDSGANIYYQDHNGNALHHACCSGDIESAKYLIDQGCDHTLVSGYGSLPVEQLHDDELEKEFLEYIKLTQVR